MAEIKYALVGVILLTVSPCFFVSTFTEETRSQASAPETSRKPVIVELFTSEGCSTCPPADALLEVLEDQQTVEGADVIALEEHVD